MAAFAGFLPLPGTLLMAGYYFNYALASRTVRSAVYGGPRVLLVLDVVLYHSLVHSLVAVFAVAASANGITIIRLLDGPHDCHSRDE